MLLTLIEGPAPTPNVLALAHASGSPVEAVTYGEGDLAELADELAKQGVARLHVLRHELLTDYAPEARGAALVQLVERLRPDGVLAAGNDRGTEVLAQAAARARLPLATNCVAIDGGETWRLTRSRGGGMLLEDAELSAPVKLATVAQGAVAPADAPAADTCEVREFVPELSPELARSRVVERAARAGGVSLATAPVIVSGGRGVGSAEGYAALEKLAARLGGAVGCSRVATNSGWRPHSDQVGLTGTKVAPDLYIACGISGATQHWVGCMDSKAILAVNTDPEAPMMLRATHAVVGDVHEVLPAVLAELDKRAGQAS